MCTVVYLFILLKIRKYTNENPAKLKYFHEKHIDEIIYFSSMKSPFCLWREIVITSSGRLDLPSSVDYVP